MVSSRANLMVDVRTAVDTATAHFSDLMGKERISDIRVEEAELSAQERHWKITLSALERRDPNSERSSTETDLEAHGYKAAPSRVNRVFTISSDTGELVSMKLR
jgi:hypothetical protein